MKKHAIWVIIVLLLFAASCGTIGRVENNDDPVFESSSAIINSESSESEAETIPENDGSYNVAEAPDESSSLVTSESSQNEPEEAAPIESLRDNAPFSMTMLDVGQGLSLLFQCDGKYMLYDGGGSERSSYVVSCLQEHDISDIDLMIASHYDEDHIAGLIGVLKTTTVQTIIDPDYTVDGYIYDSFLSAQSESGATVIHPNAGDQFSLGNAVVQIIHEDPSAEVENDRSIVIHVTYGNTSIFVTGDAEETAEAAILASGQDINSDIYVAGHHGSRYSSSDELLAAVSPTYTFISCGKDNAYGFPAEDTLNRLKAVGSQLFRSDVQGEITMFSDGNQYWFSQQPTNDWTPGIPLEESSFQETPESSSAIMNKNGTYRYVLNRHSMKFHRPYCPSVSKISEKNIAYSDETRDELISEGYEPCKYCNP